MSPRNRCVWGHEQFNRNKARGRSAIRQSVPRNRGPPYVLTSLVFWYVARASCPIRDCFPPFFFFFFFLPSPATAANAAAPAAASAPAQREKKKLFFTGRSLSSGDTSELGGGDVPPSRSTLYAYALFFLDLTFFCLACPSSPGLGKPSRWKFWGTDVACVYAT